MASLLKKMLDAMPLKGAFGALTRPPTPQPPEAMTMGQLKSYVKGVYRTPPTYTAECNTVPAAGTPADQAALWSWKVSGDPARVEQITCRVRDAGFAPFTVLETLEWGYAPITIPLESESTSAGTAGTFVHEVLAVVKLKRKSDATGKVTETPAQVNLPLTADYHLVSFVTQEGYLKADDTEPLWPLESYHDPSLVHFFLYDVNPASGDVSAVRAPNGASQPLDSEEQEVEAMLGRCDEIMNAQPDDVRNAFEELFKDNLWVEPTAKPTPNKKVGQTGDLTFPPVRILVACSLTVCRERNDFVPGSFATIARFFPHVLVVATADLVRVEAGVHFKRPGSNVHTTHMMDSDDDEMLPEIGGLLVSDSNVNGMPVSNSTGKPCPVWASLFNYYVVDPIRDPNVGTRLLPVVLSSHTADPRGDGDPRDDKTPTVNRDCSDVGTATVPVFGPFFVFVRKPANEHHVHKNVRRTCLPAPA